MTVISIDKYSRQQVSNAMNASVDMSFPKSCRFRRDGVVVNTLASRSREVSGSIPGRHWGNGPVRLYRPMRMKSFDSNERRPNFYDTITHAALMPSGADYCSLKMRESASYFVFPSHSWVGSYIQIRVPPRGVQPLELYCNRAVRAMRKRKSSF